MRKSEDELVSILDEAEKRLERFHGAVVKHKNGDLYVIKELELDEATLEVRVSYELVKNRKIRFSQPLERFLDGRFI